MRNVVNDALRVYMQCKFQRCEYLRWAAAHGVPVMLEADDLDARYPIHEVIDELGDALIVA